MSNIYLTEKEFTQMHNAMCDLRSVQEKLADVISPKIIQELEKGIRGLEAAFENAYAAEEQDRQRRHKYYDQTQVKEKFASIWSVPEIDVGGFDKPHPYPKAKKLVYVDHWGVKPVTVDIEGNTWLDLWRAADVAIGLSGDSHHCFVERFLPRARGEELTLTTGS
jgi:hypothetical protein